jgi:uncharacterized membrane protein YdjX (TVP38/TMEM64 family)
MARAASPRPTQDKPREQLETDAKLVEDKPQKTVTTGAEDKAAAGKGSFLSTLKKIVIVALLAAFVYVAMTTVGDKKKVMSTLESSISWIEEQGNTAVGIYCAVCLVGVVCLVPTTPIELAAGFLFSPKYGMWTVLCFTGASKLIANTISVFIARHVLKDWVMKNVVAKSELLTMVSSAVKDEPWKMVFLVRGSMAPLFVKNYGLGVMEVDYLPIACCSMIFTNFYAFQNIYMGAACSDLKEVFAPKKQVAAAEQDWTDTLKATMPIVFNVLLVIFLVKAVKSQVRKQKDKIQEDLKAKAGKKSD